MPFAGVNALDALVTAYQSIAQLRQHIKQSERIHGIFNEAGLAPILCPTMRSAHLCARENGLALAELKSRVQNCFEGVHWPPVARCRLTGRWATIWKLRIAGRLPSAIANAKAWAAIFPAGKNAEQRCRFDRYGQYQPSRAVHSPDDCLCAASVVIHNLNLPNGLVRAATKRSLTGQSSP